jgi:pyruvate dehydrogenase E1 component
VNRPAPTPETLRSIQRRVHWLAMRIVDAANHDRPDAGGIKVGGHQASSASMIGIMTSLWFDHLDTEDKVAVKPHASPVYHAIKYLTGELDVEWLPRLRAFGGLQAYPSRTKDPDVSDFSTGSVGLGATAPLFAAATRRYLDGRHLDPRWESPTTTAGRRDTTASHLDPRLVPHATGKTAGRDTAGPGRFIALVGDAELDEGNVWEAIADPVFAGLGNVTWIVDLNRQSLDRVIPDLKVRRLQQLFAASGWHVVEAKWGRRITARFEAEGGEPLRLRLDEMSNEEYQSLVTAPRSEVRARLLAGADAAVKSAVDDLDDGELRTLVGDLGGHDHDVLTEAYRRSDAETDRPSVVFAYTHKGWGLPIAGEPLNHSALLSCAQIDELRATAGRTPEDEWDRFDPDSDEGRWCATIGARLNNAPVPPRTRIVVPASVGGRPPASISTQEAFGRLLTAIGRHDEVARRVVTLSPDVSVSTSLGGWINKVGVFRPEEAPDWFGDKQLLRWRQSPAGQHIELGISEMNLFGLLGQLGLAHEHHGEVLLPIGTVYDPFVCRGLDSFIYGSYNASRFIVVGTPSGATLSPEGGAHQSAVTASIGLELPGVTAAEPAYAQALDWLLCDGLDRLTRPDGDSMYLRLTTRPIDQGPFAAAVERLGVQELRAAVLSGGYRLVEPDAALAGAPVVHLVASGAVLPEVVEAAALLAEEGVAAPVIDVTSADRLYRSWQSALRTGAAAATSPDLATTSIGRLFAPADRHAPIVTVHDAASHALAWIGGCFGAATTPLGFDTFGQSGTIDELYDALGLRPAQIVTAALAALS